MSRILENNTRFKINKIGREYFVSKKSDCVLKERKTKFNEFKFLAKSLRKYRHFEV